MVGSSPVTRVNVRPEKASFGPGLRFRFFAILGIAALCLWLQKRSSLALNQNLPFPDGHELMRLRSSAPDDGNAFDLVAGLKTVGIGLGLSVDDEERNQAFGQTDIPADPRQGLTFATRQLDPTVIVEKLLAV
jgi:hypothetical protein